MVVKDVRLLTTRDFQAPLIWLGLPFRVKTCHLPEWAQG